MKTKKMRRCHECGIGTVRPHATAGRTIRHKTIAAMPIPEDFEIPTCDDCGAEWLDGETTDRLGVVLEKQYGQMLRVGTKDEDITVTIIDGSQAD